MNKKIAIVAVGLAVLGAAGLVMVHLHRCSQLSGIIDDEAKWDVLDSLSAVTQMKVVILPDGMVARYVSEDRNSYTCDIQDTFTVPKEGARVEVWRAADGKGVVFLKNHGLSPAFSEPDPDSAVVLDLVYEEGELPDTCPCLGLENGWFRIDAGGQPAYIEARYVFWDAIDTF